MFVTLDLIGAKLNKSNDFKVIFHKLRKMKKQNQKLLENRSENLSHRMISLGVPVLKKWKDKDGDKSYPESREKVYQN